MKLAYISPSTLPSRSANSIHVIQQCDALAKTGVDVTLFAKRQSADPKPLRTEVAQAYGVDLTQVELATVFTPWTRANNITIAAHAIFRVLYGGRYDAILSRNLFASFLLAWIPHMPLIIEIHQLERGFRGWMQRFACRRAGVAIVTISEQLSRDLTHRVGRTKAPICVMHDAAPEVAGPLPDEERQKWRQEYLADEDREKFICGYVGHLYPGRGIEIIEALAQICPEMLFLVIGGNESDVSEKRRQNRAANLRFLGHVPHPVARRAMSSADVLLMPYQEKVSIGLAGSDTARWMSPMKMFEYMASGTAFIASDLPVLREVLRDGHNTMLVPAQKVEAWRNAVLALKNDPNLRGSLARQAYDDYQAHYTWRRRAERIAACFKK